MRLRIAFYAPLKPPDHPVASGDRAMARGLMAALGQAGHEVFVASRLRTFDAGDPPRQLRIRDVGLRIAERIVKRFDSGRNKPDLWFTYHLYHKAPDWLGPLISRRLAIPYVVAEASFAPKQAGGLWDLGHRAVADALAASSLVLQPNPGDAECVLPLLSSPERLVRLPPFLDTAEYRGVDRHWARREFATELDLDPAQPWLLSIAMMRQDQKRLSYLALARALLRLIEHRWNIVIAGAGPAEAEIRAAFAPMGQRVRWVGVLDRASLLKLFRAADVFVWPAVKEAWGMALLEAQAAGLPVVAGWSAGVAGIVADHETGLLVKPGDDLAFASAVRQMLDLDLRNRMATAAEARIARSHDTAGAVELLDRHLRELVTSHRP